MIAARHADALPHTVQSLLRTLGANPAAFHGQGHALVSYLLFEAAYTCELIALGEADAERQRDEIHRFFGWAPVTPSTSLAPASDSVLTAA